MAILLACRNCQNRGRIEIKILKSKEDTNFYNKFEVMQVVANKIIFNGVKSFLLTFQPITE